jgi:Tfp pilus assembly protein PilN
MSTATLTRTQVQSLPSVNLLPPEIAQKQRFRKVQAGLAVAVVAAAAAAGALFVQASGQVDEATSGLDAVKAQGSQLQSQAATYADVPAAYAAVEAAQAQLNQAMGQEVRWSFFLNDLSRTIPRNVWLENVTVQQDVDGATAPAGAATGTSPVIPAGVGSITFTGKAFAHNDVARWLESPAKQHGYAGPYFSNSSKAIENGRDVVSFSSTVVVTEDALSKRFTQKAGQ